MQSLRPVLLVLALLATLGNGQDAGDPATSKTPTPGLQSSSSGSFESATLKAATTPNPAPTPSYGNDDCSACCPESTNTSYVSLECCSPQYSTVLYNTNRGVCSGLPCCSYGGRQAQNRQAWYPCLIFPTCNNDRSKQAFCELNAAKSYYDGATFACTDSCCDGPVLASNTWTGVSNAKPGQLNATFAVSLNPKDYNSVFFANGVAQFTLKQVTIGSPVDYKFGENPICRIAKTSSSDTAVNGTVAKCGVAVYNRTTHLTVNIPEEFQGDDAFIITFDRVKTPSGIAYRDVNATSEAPKYSTSNNLARIYFSFNNPDINVYSSFLRVAELEPASISSGSFVPENIYPGNSGNATFSFYSNARIPKGSIFEMTFASKWGFTEDAKWSWEVFPDEALDLVYPLANETSSLAENEDAVLEMEVVKNRTTLWARNFTWGLYRPDSNKWTLTVEEDMESGWITLGVDRVQNPSVAYSGLNFAKIEARDSKNRTIVLGTFSAISIELLSEPVASPYNYVTMVVLICTLFFCTVVIRSNGLTLSLGSIWTDITAICSVLASVTAIVNNLIWVIGRGAVYFYISRLFLCFTFTMLTAVCFHWGTVLNLRLRKLPKIKTVIAFCFINLLFYIFQSVFLFYHQDLITRVYESEQNPQSYANQQCKSDGSDEISNNVFSEIQGYLWRCYAEDEDQVFVVSTTLTSAVFLALTVIVMALGVMVMRRGKLLLSNASGPHQVVLMKALRLYYTLIGVVTLVYLFAWIIQLASRSTQSISYPWYYIFTVWLPQSIPPCCLIFLQWNSTAKSLKDADVDPGNSTPLSQCVYDEIRTPSFAFSTSDRWSEDALDEFEDTMTPFAVGSSPFTPNARSSPDMLSSGSENATAADDVIGLSMSLETNEEFPLGCFVAIQRLMYDPVTQNTQWRQVSNTDTVVASRKDTGSITRGRHLYSFMAVPRIPVASLDDKVRLVVYAVNMDEHNRKDHSEMTAESVLAALERSSDDGYSVSQFTQSSSIGESIDMTERAIDELFEQESEPDSTDDLPFPTSFSTVAEFTISTDALVSSGARIEQIVLVAAENSYKQFGLESTPPKLSVHTVLPKAARAKYGLSGGVAGLTGSHSISSQYHIREQGLLVVEDLTESRFSNWIPRQILEAIIRHRTKLFMIAQNDLARLEAFDRQRQKGTDGGIYENLIQQIQDDGDISRCREWMIQRCQTMKEYLDLLRKLRRLYVSRDQKKQYFKPSTEKKNSQLRFLPINLHLQEMWVGSASQSFSGVDTEPNAYVYDIVTVGAMAAHVYKFKNGGILGLEDQRMKMKARRREAYGSMAAQYQSPLWTEEEQKAENLEWDIQKRMDVCFPQAVAALVTAFTRKIDLALQNTQVDVGEQMLEHLEKLGFLFNVESLVSTHGNEAGMLEDMAGALNELRNLSFVLVDETEPNEEDAVRDYALSFDVDEEMKEGQEKTSGVSTVPSNTDAKSGSSNGTTLSGVVDVNVFMSVEDALADERSAEDPDTAVLGAPPSPAHSVGSAASFNNVGHRLMNTFKRAKTSKLLGGKGKSDSTLDYLFGYTHLVIRVKVRSHKIKLPVSLRHGGTVAVYPVLFSQGINEKQTIANNTKSSVTRLQDVINENSLRHLRTYCDRYCNYMSTLRSRGTCPSISFCAISRDEVNKVLRDLDKLIASSRQTRKKRPEILQLSSDLCRRVGAGRVTVCKSAKDRTGMSVTLEQGRILVQNHQLPETKKADIVSVMRSEGVRIENAQKNTGRRVFAFNALQRSLLPEEYRCPPQTGGRNVS